MADYIGGSSEQLGISRRSVIKKGMLAGGVGLWAVPVLAVVTRNGSNEGGSGVTHQMTPANHGGPAVAATCQTAGSPATCITFVCVGPTPTYVECVGTPPPPIGGAVNGPNLCFCDTDVMGQCRCFANDDCADLPGCGLNGVCPPGFFCVNPMSCCGVAKCARVCGP